MDKDGQAAPVDDDFSCSYCRKSGQRESYASVYLLWKKGLHEENCWSKRQQYDDFCVWATTAGVESGEDFKLDKKEVEEPVAVICEYQNKYLVAMANMNAEGQGRLKQKRDNIMEIDLLVNKSLIFRPLLLFDTSDKKKGIVWRDKKAPDGFQDHMGKCDVVAELASAPSEMKFRQILRGHAGEAMK